MFQWISRCAPGISIILLIFLISFAFIDGQAWVLSPLRRVVMTYSILVHINAFTFSLRLIWALFWVERGVRNTLQRRTPSKRCETFTERDYPSSGLPTASHASTALRINGMSKMDFNGTAACVFEVTHTIIIPNYMEDVETLRKTLSVLAHHPRARTQYEIFLAMEQKETDAASKAGLLTSLFENSFATVRSTFHPYGMPGEIAGKSSNVAHAARIAGDCHKESRKTGEVILTVMDADTHLSQDYFSEIRRMHYEYPNDAARAFYISPIIFDRNAHDSPLLVRCADLLWGLAGLAGMYPGAPIAIPTSVYSLPLGLAEDVGGWDGDATAIGEDMHMMLKCYFGTGGNIVTRVVYSAASQCNISAPGHGWHRYLATVFARYRQALRHMWGALDTGFAIRNSFHKGMQIKPRHFVLLHLLWEAHFLPTHLTILLLFSTVYTAVVPASKIHPDLLRAFNFTGLLRTLCFFSFNLALCFYDRYHSLCVNTRARDMARAGLSDGFTYRTWRWYYLLDRILFPVAGTLYGAVPAVHAEISHFWTDRLVYRVSAKPTFSTSV